jgi:mannose-6-phosphate isomerase-like protein (cupin superfamily)
VTDGTLDLTETYLAINGTTVERLEGGEAFWRRLATGDDATNYAARGWLVGSFTYPDTWDNWERHPGGDEIVHLVSGAVDMILDLPDGHRTIAVRAGRTVVIPAGIWHTAVVHEPGHAIHITFGEGTDHRPVDAPD